MSHRVRDEGAGARAAARTDGDTPVLRVADEVPDDEEVPRELHPDDDVELRFEPLAVRFLVDRTAHFPELGEPSLESVPGDVAEVALHVVTLRHGEVREHRAAERELNPEHISATRSVFRSASGRSRKRRAHLRRRLQIHLEAPVVVPLRVFVSAVQANALEVELRLAVLLVHELDVVRRDDRQIELLRRTLQDPVDHGLLGQAMVLELDEQCPWVEPRRQLRERLLGGLLAVLADGLRHDAAEAAREGDDTLRACNDVVHRHGRDRLTCALEPEGDELDEILITLGGRCQQHEVIRVLSRGFGRH